ncbi:MAG: hypothetical protein H6582_12395 [Crocinitomicaceae bacterium]|nr:hypothetical protein [Crocinitomicaceae bacterium]
MKTISKLQASTILFFLLLSMISCSENDTSETSEEVESEEIVEEVHIGITAKDSATVNAIIDELTGIEKFAVGSNYDLLLAILEHKQDKRATDVKTIIEKQELDYYNTYGIEVLDPASGYIQYTPLGAEVTYTMTYWNMADGSQLIATENWGCGPICSSGIDFKSYKDGQYEELEDSDVIPQIEKLPYQLVPNYDPDGVEPIEFKFNLPRKGKDIEYCLDGNCINLVLEGKQFKMY